MRGYHEREAVPVERLGAVVVDESMVGRRLRAGERVAARVRVAAGERVAGRMMVDEVESESERMEASLEGDEELAAGALEGAEEAAERGAPEP